MKTKTFALLILPLAMAACSSNRNIAPEKPKPAAVFAPERDGSSFDKAIIINEKTERAGIDAENAQLNALYPGSKKGTQRLEDYKGKPYDIININTADGREITVYFDISSYFGKL